MFPAGGAGAGEHVLVWDGYDDAGVLVPHGTYEIEATASTLITSVSSSVSVEPPTPLLGARRRTGDDGVPAELMSEQSIVHLEARERQAIQAFVHQLHERFPGQVLQVTLFGSKARGDSGPWSDIDVLIIVREESWPLRGEISELGADISLAYDVLIGPRVIGQERWERMKQERFGLYRSIIAEGIPLASTAASS